MPSYVGGIPLGPPDYVDDVPAPQEEGLSPLTPDSFAAPNPGTSYVLPPQPPGTALVACGISVAYVRDRGLRGAAVAGAYPSGAAFWRVHGGACYKIVSAVFQAMGGPPSLPDPTTNYNEVLIGEAYGVPANEVLPDGQTIYVRTVQYFYLLQIPPGPADPLYGAVIQLDATTIAANAINPADYIPNLLGPIPPPSTFAGAPITF